MATLKISTSYEVSSEVEDALRSDIYVLSTILTDYRDGTSQHAKADKQLEFWRNLAFLLRTTYKQKKSGGKDGASNSVVAVTGSVEITAEIFTITAAVVVSVRNDTRSLPSNGQEEETSEAEIAHIINIPVQHDSAKARKLLEDPKTDIALEDHIRDVFTLLLHCMTLSREHLSLTFSQFTAFILFRTYRKLVSRLLAGEKTWGTNPIRILYNKWNSTTTPPESPELNVYLTIKDPTVHERLEKIGVPHKQNRFLLDATTAGNWAQVLLNALQDFEAQTGLTVRVGNDDVVKFSKSSQAPLDDRQRLLDAIVVLDQFVTSKALAYLLTKTVAKDIYDKYKKDATKSGNDKTPAATQGSGGSSPDSGTSESVDEEDEDA
ncbi:hypothetical protein C8Q80DRAFT_1124838 [Daedaleopsis nitida]|nr:hypothetical protein C8Q80DRAFT_1124838 [Daedaleopsis nitida]